MAAGKLKRQLLFDFNAFWCDGRNIIKELTCDFSNVGTVVLIVTNLASLWVAITAFRGGNCTRWKHQAYPGAPKNSGRSRRWVCCYQLQIQQSGCASWAKRPRLRNPSFRGANCCYSIGQRSFEVWRRIWLLKRALRLKYKTSVR